eukprot:CAMPEP_0119526112 /NCGR_PEP_ID=MMETSP1344-20130328/40768_1 /TAXON_ID=236787 /ORGANISM="Florenciella parvula, Strain CCMP2471" /LENGTH=542 /DNA_ID=CAMNT_0007565023 /DNA_START=267 /DNA_END=1895 /DNA_ORIENTATION=-
MFVVTLASGVSNGVSGIGGIFLVPTFIFIGLEVNVIIPTIMASFIIPSLCVLYENRKNGMLDEEAMCRTKAVTSTTALFVVASSFAVAYLSKAIVELIVATMAVLTCVNTLFNERRKASDKNPDAETNASAGKNDYVKAGEADADADLEGGNTKAAPEATSVVTDDHDGDELRNFERDVERSRAPDPTLAPTPASIPTTPSKESALVNEVELEGKADPYTDEDEDEDEDEDMYAEENQASVEVFRRATSYQGLADIFAPFVTETRGTDGEPKAALTEPLKEVAGKIPVAAESTGATKAALVAPVVQASIKTVEIASELFQPFETPIKTVDCTNLHARAITVDADQKLDGTTDGSADVDFDVDFDREQRGFAFPRISRRESILPRTPAGYRDGTFSAKVKAQLHARGGDLLVPRCLYPIGGITGTISGLTATAGGFTLIPLLMIANQHKRVKMSTTEIVGHAHVVNAVNTCFFTIGAAFTRSNKFCVDIIAVVAVMFLVGSLIGVAVSKKLADMGRASVVTIYIALLLGVVGAGMFVKAFADA